MSYKQNHILLIRITSSANDVDLIKSILNYGSKNLFFIETCAGCPKVSSSTMMDGLDLSRDKFLKIFSDHTTPSEFCTIDFFNLFETNKCYFRLIFSLKMQLITLIL